MGWVERRRKFGERKRNEGVPEFCSVAECMPHDKINLLHLDLQKVLLAANHFNRKRSVADGRLSSK